MRMKKFIMFFLVIVMSSVELLAQNVTVSGIVKEEDGTPLLGVTVVVKGTLTGTVTALNGDYSIEAPKNSTLVFSFIGMDTKEEIVNGRTTIDVILGTSSQLIDEVVVTAMGIKRSRKALGYAATSMGSDDITSAKLSNPIASLQGKVAGVDVSASAGMGTTQNVIIRGFSSFTNNQPLYIIDGVPITNTQNRSNKDNLNSQVDFGSGINALDPDNIEDMTILKGAAATALYGSRAANGVVMITTKSGKNSDGKLKVSYDGSVSFAQVGFLPIEQTMFGSGWSGDMALDENGSWGAPFDDTDRVWGNVVDNSQLLKKYKYLNNRIRDFYDLGVGYKNSVSMSGGTEATTYHLAISQNSLDGVIPTNNDSYDRYTAAFNGEHKSKYFVIGSSINVSSEKNKTVASGQGTSLLRSLYEIPTDVSIVDMKDYNNKFYNLDNYFTPYGINPYYILNENGAEQTKTKVFGKFQIEYKILPKLSATYRFGGDYESSISKTHEAKIEFTEGAPNAGSSTESQGNYERINRERIQTNHDAFLSFNDRFAENLFSVNVIAGLNLNSRSYDEAKSKISSIDIPGHYDLSNSLTPSTSTEDGFLHRLVGVYMNADFGYKDYLYLTLTGRNDWSSTLPKDNNSFFYPGAMVSYIITDFLNQQDISTGVFDFAKVRASYGKTANDTEPYYVYDKYVAGYVTNPGYPSVDDLKFPLGGINSYTTSTTLGNLALKPEMTTEYEFGLEFSLFNNRLGLDLSYYNRFTEGLIAELPCDPSSGYRYRMSNLGDVRNQGIEIMVNLTPIRTKNFSWNLSYNLSKNYNKVESLDLDEVYLSGFSGVGIYAVEGKAMGQFKSTMAETVVVNGVECTVVDGNGNPMSTTEEQFLGKDINEKYRMGLTNTFSYKGFSLSATLDFRYGGSIYSYTKNYMHWIGSSPESVLNDRNPFIIPNSVVSDGNGGYVENTTPVNPSALHTFYSEGGLRRGDYAIIDRSYLKLRNISLSYSLPKSICSNMKIEAVKISANASNFLLWKHKENQYIDPEVTTFGNDLNAKFGEYGSNRSEDRRVGKECMS